MAQPPEHASQQPVGGQPEPARCYRHPDRMTHVRCRRCGRPTCPDCMREAAVGHQCVDCTERAQQQTRRPVTVAGAVLGKRPFVVLALIALNVAVYAFTAVQAGSVMDNQRSELFSELALWSPAVAFGQWWRLLGSGFLHFGPIHIAMNMIALWVIGKDLELVLGRLRFLAVYLLSMFGGSVAVLLFSSQMTAGASGAVFGLLGGIAVAALRMRVSPGPAFGVIALNLVISISVPHISLLGHVGGLLTGAGAVAALVYAPGRQRERWQGGALVAVLAVLLGLVAIGIAS